MDICKQDEGALGDGVRQILPDHQGEKLSFEVAAAAFERVLSEEQPTAAQLYGATKVLSVAVNVEGIYKALPRDSASRLYAHAVQNSVNNPINLEAVARCGEILRLAGRHGYFQGLSARRMAQTCGDLLAQDVGKSPELWVHFTAINRSGARCAADPTEFDERLKALFDVVSNCTGHRGECITALRRAIVETGYEAPAAP